MKDREAENHILAVNHYLIVLAYDEVSIVDLAGVWSRLIRGIVFLTNRSYDGLLARRKSHSIATKTLLCHGLVRLVLFEK